MAKRRPFKKVKPGEPEYINYCGNDSNKTF